jgi:hypothetical protein
MTQRHSRRSSRSHRSHRHRSSSHRSEQFQSDFSLGEAADSAQPSPSQSDRPRPDRPRRLEPSEREARRDSGSRSERQWSGTRSRGAGRPISSSLLRLIEQDAPLRGRTQLVLMYGPFQAEMSSEVNQGVATWIQSCLRQHGIPSLVRFDDRRYAQVFRRDQFQPWVEHLMEA